MADPVADPASAWQVVKQAVSRFAHGAATGPWVLDLAEVVRTQAWRCYAHPAGLVEQPSFRAFVADSGRGLGVDADALVKLLSASGYKAAADAIGRALREETPAIGDNGGARVQGEQSGTTRLTDSDRNSATYVLARLKRDYPDLAAQVVDGTLTAHRAAIQAGIRHRTVAVRTDNIDAAMAGCE